MRIRYRNSYNGSMLYKKPQNKEKQCNFFRPVNTVVRNLIAQN